MSSKSKERLDLELSIAAPYFIILSKKDIKKNLRALLVKQAPIEFFSIATQVARHLLNKTFCSENPAFCEKYENLLYLLSLPETNILVKRRIFESVGSDFIDQIYKDLKTRLKK